MAPYLRSPNYNKIHFTSHIRDSSARTKEAMSLNHYQTDRNVFLSMRIPPKRLLLLIGHELSIYTNHHNRYPS
ncbi:hypothetical protein V6Z11_D07G120700 [Gossypium hirsutum]